MSFGPRRGEEGEWYVGRHDRGDYGLGWYGLRCGDAGRVPEGRLTLALEVYRYRIEGVSPLLMHSPKGMMEGRPAGATARRIPSPEEEAEKGAYRDEEGFLYLPSAAFKASLMHGAGGRRIGSTAARTVLAGAVFNTGPKTDLFDPETGERLREYRVHVSRVVVQRSSVIRARPELPRWACVLEFEVDLDFTHPRPNLAVMCGTHSGT